jgi:hypothetical protein
MKNDSIYPEPIGPYFDYSARSQYLNNKIRTFSELCTEDLLSGDVDKARRWAEKCAPFMAALDRLSAWYQATDHKAPERWIGWDVQKGYES